MSNRQYWQETKLSLGINTMPVEQDGTVSEITPDQQPDLFNGSQLSVLIDQSPDVSEALTDLVNKCLYTDELVVIQLQTHGNLELYQEYFLNSLDDSFDVVTVDAHLLMTTEELFSEIVEQADLDTDLSQLQGDVDKLGFVLGQVVDELRADSAELVLQVNYAHELSSSVLNQLMDLIEILRDRGAFHAVLWMDLDSAVAFESRIAPLDIEFSTLEVLRLKAAEINEYLKFVFESNDEPFAFSKEEVKQIIVGSGGEAEKVDQLAREMLETKPKFSGTKKESYLLIKSMVAVAVTALVIISILPDEDEDTQSGVDPGSLVEAERIVIPVTPQEEPEPLAEFVPPVVSDLPDENEVSMVSSDAPPEVSEETASQINPVEPVDMADTLSVDQSGITTGNEEATDDASGENEPPQEPLVEVVDAEVSVPEPVDVQLTPYERQLQELLSHADNEAFIQLFGTYDERVALDFIEDYEIDDSFYYARTDLNGRDWFVVLYGSFVSERAAINALDALPGNLQEAGPWVRNMRNIRGTVTD